MTRALRLPTFALLLLIALACASAPVPAASVPIAPAAPVQAGVFPPAEDAVRFAVIGDNGNGNQQEYQVGQKMTELRRIFPFDFVVMMGDNLYGSERPQDFVKKFEAPYKTLLDAGVKFYASLGNHDDPNQVFYKPFNMNGERYYKFTKGPVEFFALDSNYMDPRHVAWLETSLKGSSAKWKICYFHHPLYSSGGTHGSEMDLRAIIEPIFVKYGVNVVLAGHEHFYERIKPQKGITYFVCGASGQLRPGDLKRASFTAAGFDKDQSFMLVEVAGDELRYQAVTRTGNVIDSGVVRRTAAPQS